MTCERRSPSSTGSGSALAGGGDVAPFQHELTDGVDLDALLPDGLGQLTRPFGSAPVDPAVGAVSLVRTQKRIVAAGRFGIPALAHEECLAGFTAWGATAYPVPLSWGATLRSRADRGDGVPASARSMRSVGVHQGLAPVLDVVRDPRWGRVEETIGEDPYLVGMIASAYVRGLEGTGIIATLKHFVGYSASKAGRNLAPVSMGPREFADVMPVPFEMAVRESGVRSVMHAYIDIDGVPAAANRELLTGLLRDTWGFDGHRRRRLLRHGVPADAPRRRRDRRRCRGRGAQRRGRRRAADGQHVRRAAVEEIEAGRIEIDVIDIALRRVLLQKLELGLLDPDWSPLPDGWSRGRPRGHRRRARADHARHRGRPRAGPPGRRAVGRAAAQRRQLPLGWQAGKRILVVGPTADDSFTLLGCYSFPGHVGSLHPDVPIGIEIPTVLEGLRAEFPRREVTYTQGATVDGDDTAGSSRACAAARDARHRGGAARRPRRPVRARHLRRRLRRASTCGCRGTSRTCSRRCSTPARRWSSVLVEGRPYALGTAPERAAAIVASFFPGEEGAGAIAGVLSGRVESGRRLPVSVPATPGGQPSTYLARRSRSDSGTSNIDPTPRYAFGHGLTYTTFEWGRAARAVGAAEIADRRRGAARLR